MNPGPCHDPAACKPPPPAPAKRLPRCARSRRASASRNQDKTAGGPVLRALHDAGRLHADATLARRMISATLRWWVQWHDRRGGPRSNN